MLDYRNLPVKFLGQRPCLSPTDGSQQDATGDMMSTIACSRAIGLGVRLSVLCFASNCNIIFCIQSFQQTAVTDTRLPPQFVAWVVACGKSWVQPRAFLATRQQTQTDARVGCDFFASRALSQRQSMFALRGCCCFCFCAWAGMLKPGHSTPPTHPPTHAPSLCRRGRRVQGHDPVLRLAAQPKGTSLRQRQAFAS
jgi:hypothetical protein